MLDIKRINSKEELKALAIEMKISACADKCTEEEIYCKDKEELDRTIINNPKMRKYVEEALTVQPIVFEDRICINLVLTVEAIPNNMITIEHWHLSMTKIDGPKPERVPDAEAVIMTTAFFDNCEEIPTRSKMIPTIRDFIAEKL